MASEIKNYQKPKDFDAFWMHQKSTSDSLPLNVVWHESFREEGFLIKIFSLDGFTHNRLYGYLALPKDEGKFPCLVHQHGYMHHAGHIREHAHYLNHGYGVVSYDIRGQSGKSADPYDYPSGDHRLMTKGIDHPEHYYLVYVYMDAYRMLQFAKTIDSIDCNHIINHGVSQGGGIALALSGLDSDIFITLADVPSYSYLPGRLKTRNGSISEIASYIDEKNVTQSRALDTLSYVDVYHFADLIRSPIIASTGGKDQVCPEAYFFPTYERIKARKWLYRYSEAGHEGGGFRHDQVKSQWIKERFDESMKCKTYDK